MAVVKINQSKKCRLEKNHKQKIYNKNFSVNQKSFEWKVVFFDEIIVPFWLIHKLNKRLISGYRKDSSWAGLSL